MSIQTAAIRPTASATLSPRRWTVVALIFLATLVNYIDRANLSIVTVPIMRDFGISPVAMGTLLSAFFWTYALLQFPSGYLVDRLSFKWTYAGAFLLWSLASAAAGLAQSFQQLLVLRLLLGVGEAFAPPAGLAYIRRNFPEDQQGLPTALYLAGMTTGPALGALVGAAILERLGWRLLFILTGMGACVWLIPWLLLAPNDQPARPLLTSTRTAVRVSWKTILALPTFWGITIAAFFYSYYWYYYLTWLPSYLVMARGFSFLKMGSFTALPLAGTAIVSATAGRIADQIIARTGHPITVRQIFVSGGFLLGSSVLLLPMLKSPGAVLAALMISLFGIGLASANYWAVSQAASPAVVVGRVIGYQNTIANSAGICAPVVTGLLVNRMKNFDLSILVAGSSMIVAAAAFLFLVRQKDADAIRRNFSET